MAGQFVSSAASVKSAEEASVSPPWLLASAVSTVVILKHGFMVDL